MTGSRSVTPAGQHGSTPLRWRGLCGALAIAALTVAAYGPALRAGFTWNDDTFLTRNPRIAAPDGLYRFWCTTQPPDYFPLVSSTLWVEWRLWGLHAAGYHAVNVLLHAASSLLIWRILRHLGVGGAWLAALVFAVHPVNVESVAWITERKNTLSMLFYLAAILLFLRFERSGSRGGYVLSLAAFLLALLSKTSVVMLPAVLLICLWWQRGRISRSDVVRVIPFFCLAAVLGAVTIWFQYHRAIGSEVVRTDSFPSRLAGAGWAVWFYLFKALVPWPLSFVYPRWRIDPSSVVSYLPGLALLAAFALLARYRQGWGRAPLAALGYYVVTLLPVLGFLNIFFMRYSLVADHWQYVSIIGVIALVVGSAAAWVQRRPGARRAPAAAAATALVAVLTVLAWRQSTVYRNEETLWQEVVARNPGAVIAHHSLGIIRAGQGRRDEAADHYRRALALDDRDADSHNNLGALLMDAGQLDQAIEHFRAAVRYQPDSPIAWANLGEALVRLDRPDEAVASFERALQIHPDYAMAHAGLGQALLRIRQTDRALEHLHRSLALQPVNAPARNDLGTALAQASRIEEAITQFAAAVRDDPGYVPAWLNLGRAYVNVGRPDLAVEACQQAVMLQPGDADVRLRWAAVLETLGQIDRAIEQYDQVLRMSPGHAEAMERLAQARRKRAPLPGPGASGPE